MRVKENLIGFYTLLRREFIRIIRIWPQTLLPPVITVGLYFVIFGSVVGQRIGVMNGVTYIQYIVPGLIMLSIVNNSYINVVFSFFSNKFQRNIEEMLVSPMPTHAIIGGYICGGVIRGVLVGILVAILALFFTKLSVNNWLLAGIISVFTAVFLSLCGLVNGIFAKKFDDLSIIPMFVLTPLTYLGGVFYSIELLPVAWQKITYLNPVFYMVSGFRYAIFGQADVAVEYTVCLLLFGIVGLYGVCWWLLSRGIGVKS